MARPYLGNPKYTIEVLQKYHFVFQKRFGQNFLIDPHVLDKIVAAALSCGSGQRSGCCGDRQFPDPDS